MARAPDRVDLVERRIESHEEICSQRYTEIMRQLKENSDKLAGVAEDVTCLARGVSVFQKKYTETLERTRTAQKSDDELRGELKAHIIKWGTTSLLGLVALAVYEYLIKR